MTRILTFDEVLELLKISRPTLLRYIREGVIPGRKLETRWFFREDEVLAAVSGKSQAEEANATAA